MKAQLTVIILSYNTAELTKRAVVSCLEQPFQDLEVVVVDNNSSDESISTLEKIEDSRFRLVSLKKNLGFSGGNNMALRHVTTPYAMLLNSDAYFKKGQSIETMLRFLTDNPKVGMLTPKVLLKHDRIDPASHRGFPTPWNSFCYYIGLEKLLPWLPPFSGYHQSWKNLSQIHEIDACTGAGMILRTSAMREVGLLDEDFFMYGEDLDWCFRFKKIGWQIVYYPSVEVIHDKHTSGLKKKTEASRTRHAFYEAMKLFYDKHYRNVYPSFLRTLTFWGIDLVESIKS